MSGIVYLVGAAVNSADSITYDTSGRGSFSSGNRSLNGAEKVGIGMMLVGVAGGVVGTIMLVSNASSHLTQDPVSAPRPAVATRSIEDGAFDRRDPLAASLPPAFVAPVTFHF